MANARKIGQGVRACGSAVGWAGESISTHHFALLRFILLGSGICSNSNSSYYLTSKSYTAYSRLPVSHLILKQNREL